MNTKIRLLLLVVAVAPAGTALQAADRPAPPATGHVLILANERTLEGNIERFGDQYRIKRAVGETWVPADQVLWLCADLSDAYSFLHRRANLDDADERLRLAKWCHFQGLREEALTEANAAVSLQPRNQEAQRFLKRLQQSTASAPPPATSTPEPEPVPAPPVDVSATARNQFATRVQPILMNACASCHASGQGGAFKLIRTYEHGSLVPRTTQQNLTSVLAQVNLDQPRTSPLLTKAASVHGPLGQAPLSGRQLPAYHALEEWVNLTLPKNAAMHEHPLQAAVDASTKTDRPPTVKVEKPASAKPEENTTAPEPADPFDPVIFNREAHPNH